MISKFYCIMLAAICLLEPASAAQDINMDTLLDNEVAIQDQSKPGNAGKTILAATIINAPFEKVCTVIQDFTDYPNFMPNIAKTMVTAAENETSLVEITLQLPLGKIKKYRLRMTPKVSPQQCKLSWELVPWAGLKQEDTIADTSGYWLLTPHASSANKTDVIYFVYTDPGPVPMGLGWIVNIMSKDSIPNMLNAVRDKLVKG